MYMRKDTVQKRIKDLKVRKEIVQKRIKQKELEIQKFFLLNQKNHLPSQVLSTEPPLSLTRSNSLENGTALAKTSMRTVGMVARDLASTSSLLISSCAKTQQQRSSTWNRNGQWSSQCSGNNKKEKWRDAATTRARLESPSGYSAGNTVSEDMEVAFHSFDKGPPSCVSSHGSRPDSVLPSTEKAVDLEGILCGLSPIQKFPSGLSVNDSVFSDEDRSLSQGRLELELALEKAKLCMSKGDQVSKHSTCLSTAKKKHPASRRVHFADFPSSPADKIDETFSVHSLSHPLTTFTDPSRQGEITQPHGGEHHCHFPEGKKDKKDCAHPERVLKAKVDLVLETVAACRLSIESAGSHSTSFSSPSRPSAFRVVQPACPLSCSSASSLSFCSSRKAPPVVSMIKGATAGVNTATPHEAIEKVHLEKKKEKCSSSGKEWQECASHLFNSSKIKWRDKDVNANLGKGNNSAGGCGSVRCFRPSLGNTSMSTLKGVGKRSRVDTWNEEPCDKRRQGENDTVAHAFACVDGEHPPSNALLPSSKQWRISSENETPTILSTLRNYSEPAPSLARALKSIPKKSCAINLQGFETSHTSHSEAFKILAHSSSTGRKCGPLSGLQVEEKGILPGISLPSGPTIIFD